MARLISLLFLTILCSSTINLAICSNQDFGFGTTCLRNSTLGGTTYLNHIQLLLSELAFESSSLPYFNTSVGEVPHRVYGSFLCRGDLRPSLCHDCVTYLTRSLLNQHEAAYCSEFGVYGLDAQCMLHCANHPLFSVYEEGSTLMYGEIGEKVANRQQYNETLSTTVEGLVREASLGNWTRTNFATKVVRVTGIEDHEENIYVIVQCDPGMSAINCSRCLKELYNGFPSRDTQGGVGVHVNCMIKYNNQSFFGSAFLGFVPSCSHVLLVVLLSTYFTYT